MLNDKLHRRAWEVCVPDTSPLAIIGKDWRSVFWGKKRESLAKFDAIPGQAILYRVDTDEYTDWTRTEIARK